MKQFSVLSALFFNVIKVGKEKQVDLTNFAFMKAANQKTFSDELKQTISLQPESLKMEFLQSLLENNNIPILWAFALGLMTAISPSPLATNITATAYISKNISSKRKVFLSGILYSLGRAFTYTTIGLILFFGASKFHIARFFN